MTYNVFGGTLNIAQSNPQTHVHIHTQTQTYTQTQTQTSHETKLSRTSKVSK